MHYHMHLLFVVTFQRLQPFDGRHCSWSLRFGIRILHWKFGRLRNSFKRFTATNVHNRCPNDGLCHGVGHVWFDMRFDTRDEGVVNGSCAGLLYEK